MSAGDSAAAPLHGTLGGDTMGALHAVAILLERDDDETSAAERRDLAVRLRAVGSAPADRRREAFDEQLSERDIETLERLADHNAALGSIPPDGPERLNHRTRAQYYGALAYRLRALAPPRR